MSGLDLTVGRYKHVLRAQIFRDGKMPESRIFSFTFRDLSLFDIYFMLLKILFPFNAKDVVA